MHKFGHTSGDFACTWLSAHGSYIMMNRNFIPLVVLLVSVLPGACRTTDKATLVCEENNRNCHRGCEMSNSNFSQTKTAHQSANLCDVRCEKNYQSCLQRAENRNVKVIGDAPGY